MIFANTTMANHQAYADHHGYEYLVRTEPVSGVPESQNDVRWHKTFLVREALRKHAWVFWTDCDALFLNFSIGLPVPPVGAATSLVIQSDLTHAMNTGQFLIDNSAWSDNFLAQVPLVKQQFPQQYKMCGSGVDTPAFNWQLFRDCSITSMGYKSGMDLVAANPTLAECERRVAKSKDPEAVRRAACAIINVYPWDYRAMTPEQRRSVLRMHFAGPQSSKLREIRKFADEVDTGGSRGVGGHRGVEETIPSAMDPVCAVFGCSCQGATLSNAPSAPHANPASPSWHCTLTPPRAAAAPCSLTRGCTPIFATA
jgi:hypothetical protein